MVAPPRVTALCGGCLSMRASGNRNLGSGGVAKRSCKAQSIRNLVIARCFSLLPELKSSKLNSAVATLFSRPGRL